MLYSSCNRYEYWWYLKFGFCHILYVFNSNAKENYNYLSLKMAEIILQGMIVHESKTTQEASLKFDSEHKTGYLSSRSLIKEKTI